MNIFEQNNLYQDYLDNMKTKFNEFIASAANIRHKLGKYKYLFDKYAESLLDTLNLTHTSMTAEFGFTAGNSLRGICGKAVSGSDDVRDVPFGSTAKDFADSHPIRYLENSTKTEMYMVYLHSLYLKYAIQDFNSEEAEKDNGHNDSFERETVYNKIVQIIGSESIDGFNKLFSEYFFVNQKINIFISGFLNNIAYSLLEIDAETGQTVFQLILNDIAEANS